VSFEKERDMLEHIEDSAAELAVQLGEWLADEMFGDPGLNETKTWALAASQALQVAALTAMQAKNSVPEGSKV
jgi:hypothetical protein